MTNFATRTITGLSMVFILLFSLWFNPWMFAGIILAVTVLGLMEFYRLFSAGGNEPQKVFGTICGGVLYLLCFWAVPTLQSEPDTRLYFIPVIAGFLMFFCMFIFEIYRKKTKPLENIAVTATGILYVALPLSLLNIMNMSATVHFLGFSAFLLGYFILAWVYDTGAYLFGRQFGRHKFFERISPKKTWEGTIAGAFTAAVFAFLMSLAVKGIVLADWLLLALLVVVFGTFGDLAESLLKRSLNVKDSGTILPGHGGILDRFDTVFISAPFVFLLFLLRNF